MALSRLPGNLKLSLRTWTVLISLSIVCAGVYRVFDDLSQQIASLTGSRSELSELNPHRVPPFNLNMPVKSKNHHHHQHHHHHHHHYVPGLLQTSAVIAFQTSLLSGLLMSSLLGDSFLVTKLFRLFVYFVRCFPLLLVPQIFPLNIIVFLVH